MEFFISSDLEIEVIRGLKNMNNKNALDKYMDIKSLFENNADTNNAVHMSKYMKNKFKFYGIKTPTRKSLYKNFLKAEKKNNIIDWEFLNLCYEDEHREFQYLAIDYLINMKKQLTYDDIPHILKYIKLKPWWDTIDKFDRIIGNIIIE